MGRLEFVVPAAVLLVAAAVVTRLALAPRRGRSGWAVLAVGALAAAACLVNLNSEISRIEKDDVSQAPGRQLALQQREAEIGFGFRFVLRLAGGVVAVFGAVGLARAAVVGPPRHAPSAALALLGGVLLAGDAHWSVAVVVGAIAVGLLFAPARAAPHARPRTPSPALRQTRPARPFLGHRSHRRRRRTRRCN